MKGGKNRHSVLVVSASDKAYSYITGLLPGSEFSPILRAGSAGEARRTMLSEPCELIIISAPLPDESGVDFACDISEGAVGVLLMVKAEDYDRACYLAEDFGVLTVSKPTSRQTLYSSVKLLAAMQSKLCRMEQKNRTLQEKMADIRSVNRAKWLLIENLNMAEKEAHYYIEKQAMDTRLTRREVAQSIIRTYDK